MTKPRLDTVCFLSPSKAKDFKIMTKTFLKNEIKLLKCFNFVYNYEF